MAKKYLDYNGLSYLWGKIRDYFGVAVDAQTVAYYASIGWSPPSDSRTDATVDASTIDLYETLGWSEE